MKILYKKLVAAFFLAVLLISENSIINVNAEGTMPRLVDSADLLSDSEEMELLDKLDDISERQQVDIVIVTVDSLEGYTVTSYADDFYDYNGYGFGDEYDGILFLISMEERDWGISTTGYGITALTDAGIDYISEIIVPYLSIGDYMAAFESFADLCDNFITQAKSGSPYDVDNLPKEPFGVIENILVMFGIAFIISLIATSIMKGKLKTVHSETRADNYIKQNSMQLTKNSDLFLYRHVDRKKKPESTSSSGSSSSRSSHRSGGSTTHRSSSGRTHGGGSGKF